MLRACAAPLRHAPAKRSVYLVVPHNQSLKDARTREYFFQHKGVVARSAVVRGTRSTRSTRSVVVRRSTPAVADIGGEKLELGKNLIHFSFNKFELDVKCVTGRGHGCRGCTRATTQVRTNSCTGNIRSRHADRVLEYCFS